jgi:hypothetical protein
MCVNLEMSSEIRAEIKGGFRRWLALAHGWQWQVVMLGWVAILVGALVLPQLLFLPALSTGGRVATPTAALSGWAATMLALVAATEPAWPIFLAAPHRVRAINVLRVLVVAVGGGVAVVLASDSSLGVASTATMALVGEAALLGYRVAWIFPSLHLLAASSLGSVNRIAGLSPWAWILAPETSLPGLMTSGALLLAGAIAWYRSFSWSWVPGRD